MDNSLPFVISVDPTIKAEAVEVMRQYMHTPKRDVKGLHEQCVQQSADSEL